MPLFHSKDGVWFPGKEKVALIDKNGEPYVYEGPDRAALELLAKEYNGAQTMGQPFWEDAETIERAHEKKMTVDEFCKVKLHPQDVRDKDFEVRASKVNLHKSPDKKAGIRSASGGKNTAIKGNSPTDLSGDFGEPDLINDKTAKRLK